MTTTQTITLRQGQQVAWPRSPDGVAQVDDLLQSRVVLLYRRGLRVCRAIVSVTRLARIEATQPVLPGFELPVNYLDRAILRGGRVKTFDLTRKPKRRPTLRKNDLKRIEVTK